MSHDLHKTVLLKEAVDALDIKADGIYVDGTFGRGGHSREMLLRLGTRGRVIALDRDPQAVAAAERLGDARLTVRRARFSALPDVLRELAVKGVDGVLLDLGVSSPQLDEAGRGFSFKQDGPLDMRMDREDGLSAAQWLMQASEKEIGEVIKTYGEERFAKQIARAIVAARSQRPVERTRELAEIVAKAVPTREPRQDPATRTFQALRIFINQELEELEMTLPQCVACLKPGGRLVVISFHSLEDRIVKRFMTRLAKPEVPKRLPLRDSEMPRGELRLIGKPVRPDQSEVQGNPRARSAIMRVAERLAA
ncbi:MAG: 16S rRNA (cytosine(1402)-N(4))-methyltransferase RsmH [Betaproteobacteria bacterium]|nr:MAG: 16S rRNA (cytosine(1402)-N(4))-methyltransferase RsmH [Betaproteobacteria bacterium]